MATDTTQPFQIRSLIGSAGVGSNGEKLVNALSHLYPAELTAAQLGLPNERLAADLDFADVSKIAGDGIDVRDATVRGGELRDEDAWVTYAGYDANGDTVKGAFPYTDLGKASSEGHVSQTDRLQGSEAARDFALAQAKADAAAQATPTADAGPVDPIANYEAMDAREVVAYLDDNPDRVEVIQALEQATKGDKARKSVMEYEPPKGDDGSGGDSS